MLRQWLSMAALAAALLLTMTAMSQAQYGGAGTGYFGGGNYTLYYGYGYPFYYGYGYPYYYGPRYYPPRGPIVGAPSVYGDPTFAPGQPYQTQGQALPVTIDVKLPADAELWIEGKKMTQKGALRKFVSPALTVGERYTYEFRVKWKEGDKLVTRTQSLDVTPGQQVKLDLTKADKGPGRIDEFSAGKKADSPPKGPGRIEEFPTPKKDK
jgi:uncharacterized protein (TIGR03000 family)